MATSGNKGSNATSHDSIWFNWWQIEQSISGNYTKIGWNVVLTSDGYGHISSSAAKEWYVTVAGQDYSGTTTVGIGANSSKVLASGETIIYHNDSGHKDFTFAVSQYFGITFSNQWIGWVTIDSGYAVLEPIPRQARITHVADFTDLDNPTVYFENPAGSAVTVKACISWTGGDDIAYETVTPGATSHTFSIKDNAGNLNKLYAATVYGSNSRYVTFYITTFGSDGSIIGYSTQQRLFTITDCVPTLNPTVVDTGETSIPITGGSVLLRYFNYPSAIFDMESKKGASIISRTVTCGSQILNADKIFVLGSDGKYYDKADTDFSTIPGVTPVKEFYYAQFNNVDNGEFKFVIKDNRGNTVEKTVKMDMLPYVNPTCNMVIYKDLTSDNKLNLALDITGKYYDGKLNADESKENTLNVEYRFKINDGSGYPEEWIPINNPTITDTGYKASVDITGLDYTKTYSIQARVKDAVYAWGVNAKEEQVYVFPVFDWGENDFNFNVPVTIQGGLVKTYGQTNRIARAYTQEADIEYANDSYIKLFRANSPKDLYNQNIATFNDNGLITINKAMIALVNIHIVSSNPNNRSWITLWNYNSRWKFTDCIQYGTFTTSNISIILKLSAGDILGVRTEEAMTINASGLTGSYIEIIEL